MVEKVRKHEVIVERDDNDTWFAWLAEDRRCHTWGRTLASVRERMSEAVALWFEKEPTTFELMFDIGLPPEGRRLTVSAQKARAAAEKATLASNLATSNAATGLIIELGLSLRDAGELLGLSHQRIQQLVEAERNAPTSYRPAARSSVAIAERHAPYSARRKRESRPKPRVPKP